MKTTNRTRRAAWITGLAFAMILGVGTPAMAQGRVLRHRGGDLFPGRFQYPVAPGELGRLAQQSYDDHYRNSNGNVFRSSRHNSPFGNVFRSSRHYQRKLAASYDGYPVRTWSRVIEGEGRRARERVYSFAHHGTNWSSVYPLPLPGPFAGDGWNEPNVQIVEVNCGTRHVPQRPRTRAEIEMTPVRLEPPRPAQRAVLRTETGPDGRVRTYIESVTALAERD